MGIEMCMFEGFFLKMSWSLVAACSPPALLPVMVMVMVDRGR